VIFLFLNADGVAMWSRSVGGGEDGLWVSLSSGVCVRGPGVGLGGFGFFLCLFTSLGRF
jgi:hypothetical protein